MKVSIIIPIYNVAPYIERCLKSVFDQSYLDIEVILVDDCSKDNSVEVIEHFVENCGEEGRVTLIRKEDNGGASVSRNIGLRAAKGEYIYFLDGDDEITLDCIEKLVAIVTEQGVEMAISGVKLVGDNRNNLSIKYPDTPIVVRGNKAIKRCAFKDRYMYIMPVNKLIKRSFVIDNNLFFHEGVICEDEEWSFFMAQHLESVGFCIDETYIYWMRGDSVMGNAHTTHQGALRNYNSLYSIIETIFKYLSSKSYDGDSTRFVLRLTAYLLTLAYSRGLENEVDLSSLYQYRGLVWRYALKNFSFGCRVLPILLPKSMLKGYIRRNMK